MGNKTVAGNWARVAPRRQPGEQTATVLFQPFGYRSLVKATNPTRRRQKDRDHQQALMMHAMLDAIGRNPVYENSPNRPVDLDLNAWPRAAKKWLDLNMSRFVEA